MKKNATDELLLMAQMMSDIDDGKYKTTINSIIPFVWIIIAGIVVAIITLYSAKQWESLVATSLAKSHEKAYHNEFSRNLLTLKKNTTAIQGFFEASNFVSAEEFKTFSSRALNQNDSGAFMAVLDYEGNNYIHTNAKISPEYIDQLIAYKWPRLTQNQYENHFIITPKYNNNDIITHSIRISPKTADDPPMMVLSGMFVSDLLSVSNESENASLTLKDSVGAQSSILQANPNQSELSVSESSIDDATITIVIKKDSSINEISRNIKWILVGFSVLFTAFMLVQYALTRKSIRKLSNLAVERANDLTTINNELSDEILSRVEFQSELVKKTHEIQKVNEQLEEAQNQLIQQEKLASLGQLAAGVAHEINNPVGFINSNLTMLKKYAGRTLELVEFYDELYKELPENPEEAIANKKKELKYKSAQRNMIDVVDESLEGVTRVKKIVQDLKNFSRIDESEWQWADIHSGIDSTLNIVWNEVKYKAEVHKDYGELPKIECVPSQINQVIMNLLVNSAHAMEQSGNIYIRTSADDRHITVEVEDDGCGIPQEILGKIFDPFFTTKEVGKGTGLGLSLSYGIIKKHNGDLDVKSVPGEGTTFTITLPISRVSPEDKAA